ncbi:amidohydrolase [Algoriphagus sp. SE2]|uniref:amidohydrolase n=1 Tax=Algoriphagus sp. SE2 TaxID=3141536 RepID=UPI0031CD8A05
MKNLYKKSKMALLVMVMLGAFSCKEQQEVEQNYTLFHGGTILTVDEAFSEVEAMVIKDQKIVAVGSFENLNNEYGQSAKLIDLEGRTMLPGFIDAHSHAVSGALANNLMDYIGMSRFKTTEEVLEYLRQKVKETPEGDWITGRNWDPAVQDGPEELTTSILDSISTQHPIFILNASGHLAYANSRAFEASGIDSTVENPDGAEFVKDSQGNLNGVMKNMLSFIQVMTANPKMQTYDPVPALLELLDEWSAEGVTTSSEFALGAATNSPADLEIMLEAAKNEAFHVRLRAYPSYIINDQWNEIGLKNNTGNDLAKVVGFKLVADGSNQGFTGLQRETYCCSASHMTSFGNEYTSVDDLYSYAKERTEQGFQLAIHGNGDKAIDNILAVLQRLKDEGYEFEGLRPRIEHASILHDDQIRKMKELGVTPSFLIGHVYYWGTFMRDEVFGKEKVQLLDRCASVEKVNMPFSLHSDFMVTNTLPLEMIETAVTRRTWKEPDYQLAPQEAISVESAIKAVTAHAAWQLMSEDEIGSLEVGKYADMVILEEDPRKVEPTNISEIKVLETWFNGKKVYQLEEN